MAASSTSVLSTPPYLEALIPRAVSGADIRRLPLRPEEAFVWSRVDGHCSIRELCFTTGLPIEGVFSALQRLIAFGALHPVPGLEALPSNDLPCAGEPAPTPGATQNPNTPTSAGSLSERIQALERAFTGDYYQVLGVPRGAERTQVKEAYFQRVGEVHPDRFFGQDLGEHKATLEQLFQKLTVAHDTLTRSKRKEAYDATLPPAPGVVPPPAPTSSVTAPVPAVSDAPNPSSREIVANNTEGSIPSSRQTGAHLSERESAPARMSVPPDVTLRPRRPVNKGPHPGLPSVSQTLPAQNPSPVSVVPRAVAQAAQAGRIPVVEALRMASSLLSERPPPPNSAAALSAPPSSGGSSADVLRTAREAAARGDHAAALQHYSKVTGTGSSSQLLREVAQCARAAKRPQKAVELLRLALVTEPNTPELHSLLGEVYACAGMLSSAKSAFARALELKPNDDNCKLWLKRIERGDVH